MSWLNNFIGLQGISQGLYGSQQGINQLAQQQNVGFHGTVKLEISPISYEPLYPIAIKHNGRKLIIWEP